MVGGLHVGDKMTASEQPLYPPCRRLVYLSRKLRESKRHVAGIGKLGSLAFRGVPKEQHIIPLQKLPSI
jgi:hypothetical protein